MNYITDYVLRISLSAMLPLLDAEWGFESGLQWHNVHE